MSAQTMITGAQIRNPITPVQALPTTCVPYGTVFLTTTKTAYICTAPNTFVPLSTGTGDGGGGGGSTAISTSQLTDFAPSIANGIVTIQPGRIRFGTMSCLNFNSPATVSVRSMTTGSGVAKLYVASTCALVLEYPNTLTITFDISGISAIPMATPSLPGTAYYLGDVSIGPSSLTAVADKRAVLGLSAVVAGAGIVIDCTLGPCLASVDQAVVPTFGGNNVYSGVQDATMATTTKPSRVVGSDPSGACSNSNEVVLSTASGNGFSCLNGTWHAMGGGGGSSQPAGSQYVSTGAAAVGTNTGNCSGSGDCIVAATTGLPALPAGACWDYEAFFSSSVNAGTTPKVWFGTGMSIQSDYSAGSYLVSDTTNNSAYIWWIRGQICNNNGSRTAQTATMFPMMRQGSGGFGTFGSMSQDTTSASLQIGLSTTNANAITVQSFRVWRTQ
jgi:hypothetical protein